MKLQLCALIGLVNRILPGLFFKLYACLALIICLSPFINLFLVLTALVIVCGTMTCPLIDTNVTTQRNYYSHIAWLIGLSLLSGVLILFSQRVNLVYVVPVLCFLTWVHVRMEYSPSPVQKYKPVTVDEAIQSVISTQKPEVLRVLLENKTEVNNKIMQHLLKTGAITHHEALTIHENAFTF